MSLDIKIRKVTPQDLDPLMVLEESSFDEDAYSREYMSQFLDDFPDSFWVAEKEGEIVGYIVTGDTEGEDEIRSVAVREDMRGQGLGTTLIKLVFDYLKGRGKSLVNLHVRQENVPALSLYQKLGFQVTETLEHYGKNQKPFYKMTKDLNG